MKNVEGKVGFRYFFGLQKKLHTLFEYTFKIGALKLWLAPCN